MNRIDLPPKELEPLEISRTAPNGRSCSNQSTNLNPLTPPNLHPTLNPQPSTVPPGDLQCPIDDSRVPTTSGITPGHNSSDFPKLRWLSPDFDGFQRIRMFLLLPLRIRWMFLGRIFFRFLEKNDRLSIICHPLGHLIFFQCHSC